MKISTVVIKNYRAIEFLKIDFKDNINFLYGENGAGKSSIIYAINDLLTILNDKNDGVDVQKLPLIFDHTKIRNINKTSYILIKYDNNVKVYAIKFPFNINKTNRYKRIFKLIDGTIINYGNINNTINICNFALDMRFSKLENRTIYDEVSIFKTEKSSLIANFIENTNFNFFKRNIIHLINKENSKNIDQAKIDKVKTSDPVLNLLRKSIAKFDSSFSDLSYTVINGSEILRIKKNGIELDFGDQLSAGEAYIITLLGVICILLETKSYHIVCIDEIDRSLHPKWQLRICKVLKDIFHHVQFIITSHSPFIWYIAEREDIIWLKIDNKNNIHIDKNIPFAKGAYIDNVVASCFGMDIYDQDVAK